MPSNLCRSASTLSHILRIAAASSGSNVLPSSCGRAVSKRSSWRRVLSMKASPSAMVIVFVGSENPSTLDADINPSSNTCRANDRGSSDHAKSKSFSQAKNQNCGSRRRWDRDISAPPLLRIGHGNAWYFVPILNTICRNASFANFPFEQCKGDLSIRFIFSTGWVLRYCLPTTFSASKGRS